MEAEGEPQKQPDDKPEPVMLRVVITCNLRSGEVTVDLIDPTSVTIETHRERSGGTTDDPGKPVRP